MLVETENDFRFYRAFSYICFYYRLLRKDDEQ